jgi:clan AA aspartic protease
LTGSEVEIPVILDTGFSDYLTLPQSLIDELAFRRRDTTQIKLADGSFRRVEVFEGRVWWNYEWLTIPIQASEGDPLLGMALLHKHLLTVDVISQGDVTIETLE